MDTHGLHGLNTFSHARPDTTKTPKRQLLAALVRVAIKLSIWSLWVHG